MEDKESWLAALLEKEPEGSNESEGLYRTAALVRAAVNAPEVPESAQSQSRALALQQLQQIAPAREQHPPRPWFGRLGSWLQVAFNLFKRR